MKCVYMTQLHTVTIWSPPLLMKLIVGAPTKMFLGPKKEKCRYLFWHSVKIPKIRAKSTVNLNCWQACHVYAFSPSFILFMVKPCCCFCQQSQRLCKRLLINSGCQLIKRTILDILRDLEYCKCSLQYKYFEMYE